ncbi:MAG: hypothetical protein R2817_14120 [Flavobacteriales bacterium]
MEKRLHLSCEAALLTALFALFALSLLAAPASPDAIRIAGQLYITDGHLNDAVLVVELEDAHCLYAELRDDGRFHMDLPVNSRVRLHFMQPGHLPKEVVVDTRNALNTPKALRENRKVKFEVVLESEEQRPGLRYEGPVGAIRFVNGTGTMKVMHDLRVVADVAP